MGDLPTIGTPGGVSSTVMPAAPYENKPPSPPFIHVPLSIIPKMTLNPSMGNLATLGITPEEYQIITKNGTPQHAHDLSDDWTYATRRQAQEVLDWLYLGPHAASRDRAFLEREGITLILAVGYASDLTTPSPLMIMGPTAATRALGIPVDRIDVKSMHHLAKIYTAAARKINDHVLDVHRSQVNSGEAAPFKRGKVLVICETGNDRSAMVVAAYLMVMFGLDLLTTFNYISMKRFSAMYDEDSKRLLVAWHDILEAQRSVTAEQIASPASKNPENGPRKRGIETTFDDYRLGAEGECEGMDVADDESRFGNRTFTPFMDTNN